MKKVLFYSILMLICFSVQAQDIVSAEYFYDTDPGIGQATTLSFSGSGTFSETFTTPTTGLTPGFHWLNIRVQHQSNGWSLYDRFIFYISGPDNNPPTPHADIVAAEYFLDEDPGFGNGTPVTLTATGENDQFMFEVDFSGIDAQQTNFFLRVQDSNGEWSLYDFQGNLSINPTIPILDENFEQALIDLGIDTNGLTGDILSDAGSVTILDLEVTEENGQSPISDLTGIEGFVSLTELNVNGNELTSLDLSANTVLEILNIRDNQLASIDVSQSVSLEELYVPNNLLTTLNVTANPGLESLDLSNNQLTTLNVTQNLNLRVIVADSNMLNGVLDLSQNTALEDIFLQNIMLNSIDVSIFPNLINLNVSYNGLSELDVTQNPQLNTLYLSDNELTTLDMTQNPNLERLNTEANDLSTLNLSQNPNLEWVFASENELETLNIKNGNNAVLTTLEAQDNPLLTCIQVDEDSIDNIPEGWIKDEEATYSSDCNPQAQTIPIPDENFEQALIDLGIDTNGLTGDILIIDAEGVNILDLENLEYNKSMVTLTVPSPISDLTGIEGFVHLIELNVDGNPLTSLDLSVNTALEVLNANNNQLISIDVSQNTALQELNIYNSVLTTLDVTANLGLEILNVSNNQLTALDVTQNINLTELEANDNMIGSIDLTQNTALEVVQLEGLMLTSIDLSIYPNLIFLNVHNNALSELDVTQNLQLEKLYVGDNDLTTLNVSQNPNLNRLYFERNNLSTIDVTQSPNLERLVCESNNFSDLNLSQNQNLKWLYAGDNNLETVDLSNNLDLERLYLYQNKITSFDATALSQLQVLDLQEMQDGFELTSVNTSGLINLYLLYIGDNDVETIDVSSNTALNYLGVNHLPMTDIDVTNNALLAKFYGFTSNFAELDLANNPILETVSVFNNPNLATINVKNGNNMNLVTLEAMDNPSLLCIQIDEDFIDNIPTGWEKDESATYTSDCSTLSIAEITKEDMISVYPNPVNDVLYINLPQNLRLNTIRVFDVSGKVVFSSTEANTTIDFSRFQAGIYFVELSANDKRVIKEVVKH